MEPARAFPALAWRQGRYETASRNLAAEAAVAISYNGTSHAVLMASPADLEDLALGFSISEGIATRDEVEAVDVLADDRGFDVQVRLATDAESRLAARRRAMAGPVGCGMCGLESIDAALREPPRVDATARLRPGDVAEACAALTRAQALNQSTRSVHGSGYYVAGRGLVAIREDVGRHNALDKLVGAMARAGGMGEGAVVTSSRVSIELIQKTAASGCGILIAVSAPTLLAVEMAERAGITLAAIARGDEFEIFTHPDRIKEGALPHVA
ncbi:formate dehydrogenase accessory sulfurtransferase FdhD [Zhengella sp. ZM62]|uniref:formate dehydrogenase accessory sulfurtransferase FdhD n=1 Tax=Zhengella sedimenti TaxID=3390035 RepID=UPI0039747CED